jgi:hypothetical protein
MEERVELTSARIDVHERSTYLYMVEIGVPQTVAEVAEYGAAMLRLSERTRMRRALIDSRANAEVDLPDEVRDAMFKWMVEGGAFDQIAYVLGAEMQVARLNMVALSQKVKLRAFATVHEAHRWLAARSRGLSSQSHPRVDAPEEDGADGERPSRMSTTGTDAAAVRKTPKP